MAFNPNDIMNDWAIGGFIHQQLKKFNDDVMQINESDDSTVTNKEVLHRAINFTLHLRNNLVPDDVVAISAKNSANVLPIVVGCLFNCTPFQTIDPTLEINQMKYIFNQTKPRTKIILCDGQDVEKIKEASADMKPEIYTFTNHVDGVQKVNELFEKERSPSIKFETTELTKGGGQLAAIRYVAGNEGIPTAISVSNLSLICGTFTALTGRQDVMLNYTNLYEDRGIETALLPCIHGCKRIISCTEFTPQGFVDIINKYSITQVEMSPLHLNLFFNWTEAIEARDRIQSVRIVYLLDLLKEDDVLKVKTLFPNTEISYVLI